MPLHPARRPPSPSISVEQKLVELLSLKCGTNPGSISRLKYPDFCLLRQDLLSRIADKAKQRCQEPNTPFLLKTVPDTNGTVVIVSYFMCSVYAIRP
jgi:hypothetical protein